MAAAEALSALDTCLARRPCGSAALRAALAKGDAAAAALAAAATTTPAASSSSSGTAGAAGGAGPNAAAASASGCGSAAFGDALQPRLAAARRRLEAERAAEALHKAAVSAAGTVADLPRLEAAILHARKLGADELAPDEYRAASELRSRLTGAARARAALDAALRGLAAVADSCSEAADAAVSAVTAAVRDAERCVRAMICAACSRTLRRMMMEAMICGTTATLSVTACLHSAHT